MDPVERLRAIALVLPEVTEKLSHGEVSFFCRKQFVMVDDHHHGADHLAFWCAAPPGVQEELIGHDSERYFRPPYVGHRGWVGVRVGGQPDWDEIGEVVRDAYHQVAPRRLVTLLDARLDGNATTDESGRLGGQPYEGDPAAVVACAGFVSGFDGPTDGGLFGPPVTVPDDAPPLHRLLGATGRDPAWSPA